MKRPVTDSSKFSLPGVLAVKRVNGVPTVFPADTGEVVPEENLLKVSEFALPGSPSGCSALAQRYSEIWAAPRLAFTAWGEDQEAPQVIMSACLPCRLSLKASFLACHPVVLMKQIGTYVDHRHLCTCDWFQGLEQQPFELPHALLAGRV